MSEKRKLDSDSDPESEPNNDNSSHKRKPEDIAVDDYERNQLKRFEEKYEKRYTLEDEEYKQCVERPPIGPPILTNYFGKRSRDRFRGNDRYGGHSGHSGRGGHRPNYSHDYSNRSSNWSQRPYNRY